MRGLYRTEVKPTALYALSARLQNAFATVITVINSTNSIPHPNTDFEKQNLMNNPMDIPKIRYAL